MKTRLALIAALDPRMGIGEGDRLPWRMPRDMKFFRRTTRGHVVIMGRRTFESIGAKPLPHRLNVVISRSREYAGERLFTARSIEEAVALGMQLGRRQRLFVIGGASVYAQALELADEMYLTIVEQANPSGLLFGPDAFPSDTSFPVFDTADWQPCHVSRHYRALDTLRGAEHVVPNLYFRFWKLVRRSLGCSRAEGARIRARFGGRLPRLPIERHDTAA